MPLNTGAALAVSLIPAAVIVLYNIMENGVPGGDTVKNFVSSDNQIVGSASSLLVKNVSIIVNSTSENIIESINEKIKNLSPPTITSSTDEVTTALKETVTEAITSPTTTTSRTTFRIAITTPPPTTTTPASTTTIMTTGAPVPLQKLSVCCNKLRVVDNRIVGNCAGNDTPFGEQITEDVWNVPATLMGTGTDTKFTLQTLVPGCSDGTSFGQLSLSANSISEDHFLANGMLKYKNEYYHPDEYCIQGSNETKDILKVQICNVNCSNPDTPCVHKCCEYDEIYSMGMKGQRGGCLRMDPNKNESLWSPALYDEFGGRLTPVELTLAGIRPHVIQSNPTKFRNYCPRNATTVFPYGQQVADFLATVLHYPFSSLKFMMRKDGWLMNPNGVQRNVAISQSKRTTKYCIDGVMNYGEADPFLNLEEQTVLFLCLGAAEELELSNSRKPKSESLVAASSNNQPQYSTTVATLTTSTSSTTTPSTTTAKSSTTPSTTSTTTTTATTTTLATTPKSTTTTTTSTTTTSTSPSTTSSTTSEKPTTKIPSTTTTAASTTTLSTSTTTTTEKSTTVLPTTTTTKPTTTPDPTTTTTETTTTVPTTVEPQTPPPTLPICCPLNPEADDTDNGNEVSHHCKSSGVEFDSKDGSKSNFTSSMWIASPNFMHTHKIAKFRMEVKPLKCQKWTKAFVHNLGKLLSPTEPVLMPNGMLKMGNDYFREGEFCVNGVFPNIVEVLVCKTNCSDPETPCIQKCCAPGEVYSLGVGGKKRGCIPLSEKDAEFNPPLYKDMGTKLSNEELDKMTPHLIQKYPPKFQYSCYKNVTLVFPFSSDVLQLMSPLAQINLEFRLRQDGKVIYKHPSIRDASGDLIESAFSTYNFCVDGIRHFGEPQGPYKNAENQTILFVCAVSPPGKES